MLGALQGGRKLDLRRCPALRSVSMSTPPKSPFAALAALKDALPEGTPQREPPRAKAAPDPFAGKIVLSISRKGRGGRTVTIVAGIRGGEAVLEELCRELKKALGCGASVDGETIVVSGDIVDRTKAWLETKGAKKLIVGT
jgi:translation initiation factor 1